MGKGYSNKFLYGQFKTELQKLSYFPINSIWCDKIEYQQCKIKSSNMMRQGIRYYYWTPEADDSHDIFNRKLNV